MPNYLLFLSMVHEYAYFLGIYLETGLSYSTYCSSSTLMQNSQFVITTDFGIH